MKLNKPIAIASTIIILYTVLGFFLLPTIIKSQIEKQLNNILIHPVTVSKVTFNPYLFKLGLFDFTIKDKDKNLFHLKKLEVDFSLLKSMEKQHIHFKQLLISEPTVYVDITKDGKVNLASLLKEVPKESSETKTDKNSEASMIKFKIAKTILDNATIHTSIQTETDSSKFSIEELSYVFYDLGTYNHSLASHKLRMKINKNTLLNIDGGFQLEPLKLYGNLSLENIEAEDFFSLKKELFNFVPSNAIADVSFGFQIDSKNEFNLNLTNGQIALKDLHLTQKNKKLLGFNDLKINNLSLRYPKQEVMIDSIELSHPYANVNVNKKGEINLSKLLKASSEKKSEKVDKKQDSNTKSWIIAIKDININDIKSTYEDAKSLQNLTLDKTSIALNSVQVKDENIDVNSVTLNTTGISFKDKSNHIKVAPTTILVNKVSKKNEHISIPKISLNSKNISLENPKEKTNVSTKNLNIKVDKLHKENEKITINKIQVNQPYATVKTNDINIIAKHLNLNVNSLLSNDKKLQVKSSQLKQPNISITMKKKPHINKKEDSKKKKTVQKKVKKSKLTKDSSTALALHIGPVKIQNAKLTFEDKNLPIPFKTNITKLQGDFSSFISNSVQPTKLNVEGVIDQYGYTKITGLVDHEDIKDLTDVNMIFKNIAINNFTPYSGKFIGRELEAGKLNLNLKYNIKKSNLDANNSIIITDIKLGKPIDSPNALSLPLELAIALMEDSNGVIDLELPITGNIDDPKFSVAPIVWKAFTNLIIKAVTSPFSFLASLLGLEGEELKSIEFAFGELELLPSEQETLDNLAKAFAKRPNIALKIKPAYHEELDTQTIQNKKFEALIALKQKTIKNAEDTYLKAMELSFEELNKEQQLKEVKEKFIKKIKGKSTLDKDEYSNYLQTYLIQAQQVSKEELIDLSKKRLEQIYTYFKTNHDITKERIKADDSIEVISNKKAKWVEYNLEIIVKK